ncbi:HD-GYP domain-containing protein [Bacillus testis]|uniref:HD-GYP domain-containing protein n=1 Tax=Bacillus testis TaxID=1622072 RepID=UPI000A641CC4|nr:HD-GYP domain-containing protein [Bacillus testis]
MKIKLGDLTEGCILERDIQLRKGHPIAYKKTIVTNELIEVLNAFLIKELYVEKYREDGKAVNPKETSDADHGEAGGETCKETSFLLSYMDAVKSFKKLFKGWQAGSMVDVPAIRNIFVPLLEKALPSEEDLFSLHHYTNKNDYFYHHAISVGLISAYMAKKLYYNQGDIVQVGLAGCLSDIGMAKIPNRILAKERPLTQEEFKEIKNHPLLGYQMLQKSTGIKKEMKLAILQHHERLDGSGYPNAVQADKIHPFSRIVAVADVFHAMASDKVYRPRLSSYRVLELMMHDEFGKFDIEMIDTLVRGAVKLSIGTSVELSDGRSGEIMFMSTRYPMRPMVKISDSGELIDLDKERAIYIVEKIK